MPHLLIPHHRPQLPWMPGAVQPYALPVSKSLVARTLVLSYLEGRSTLPATETQALPEDIRALHTAIAELRQGRTDISVRESGTAMRLMAAAIAATTSHHPVRLYGLGRQHERPIAPLVDALRALGADIAYLDQEGFPPLSIRPSRLQARTVELDASASSQYLSALLLIAPVIEGTGYSIHLGSAGLTSAPYAEMTRQMMAQAGYHWTVEGRVYRYAGRSTSGHDFPIERDWTAASYAYLLMTLATKPSAESQPQSLLLEGLRLPSLQGDSLHLPSIAQHLGIRTEVMPDAIRLTHATSRPTTFPLPLAYDCQACPDLVPTIVAMAIGSGCALKLHGVATLRLKESDRLMALANECASLGVILTIGHDQLSWDGRRTPMDSSEPLRLRTYADHRIAMALAPLMSALHPGGVVVEDADVVGKSFPNYWDVLRAFGYQLQPIN